MKYVILLSFLVSSCGPVTGRKGDPGQPGSSGIGVTGPTGADGAPARLEVVQFCPGYTTTYPTAFPEQGFCINHNLYAVFWDGTNSWLTEISPGQYMSTSTSAPCNFVVEEDCTVSQ